MEEVAGSAAGMTAGVPSGDLETELENVCRELGLVDAKVSELLDTQSSLQARRDRLSNEIQARKKRRVLPQHDWRGDDFEWSERMNELLRGTFGLDSWRTNQKEIVNATLSGRDAFVVMRTGGGKSLCYQLPALLKGGITVVVSPLISLIEDQTRYLNDLVPGSAAMLSAGMDKRETNDVYRRMRGDDESDGRGDGGGGRGAGSRGGEGSTGGKGKEPELVMVLVTPEKVVKSKMFMAALDKTAKNGRLARIVIDEAHCCSQWGHDFRPEYCKLGILKRQFGHVPVLAVTATCTDFIRDDVMKILNLSPGDVVCFKSSFNRANLKYEVMDKPEAAKDALELLASLIKDNYSGEAGIVYAFSRKEASDVAAGLASRGIPAAFYHAGQEERERSRVQRAWMTGDVPVIVATIAFGMGINHLKVRFVVHFSLSKSLENYYQESGRAGRDGKPSRCVVLYRPSDVSRQATLSCQDQGSQPLATLHKMVRYCQTMATCRRTMIAEALGEQGGKGLCEGGCDVCSGRGEPATTIDATAHATTLVRILRHLALREQRVTPRQLVEAWRAKKGAKAMPDGIVGEADRPPKALSRSTCERLVLQLLGDGVLCDDFHFTAFSVVHYVVTGARAQALESGRLSHVLLEVRESEGRGGGAGGSTVGGTKSPKASGAKPSKPAALAAAEARRKNEAGADGARGGAGSGGGQGNTGKKRPRSGKAGGTAAAVAAARAVGSPTATVDAGVVDLCDSEEEGGEEEDEGEDEEQERWSGGGDGDREGGGRSLASGGRRVRAYSFDNDSDDFQPVEPKRGRTSKAGGDGSDIDAKAREVAVASERRRGTRKGDSDADRTNS